MPLCLDEVRDDVEGLVEVLAVFGLEVGNGAEQAAPGGDLAGHAGKPLLGAEVQVEAAARVELRGDLREAGSFGGRSGTAGAGFLGLPGGASSLLQPVTASSASRASASDRVERAESFHSRVLSTFR